MFYVVLFIVAGAVGASVLACQTNKTDKLNETAREQRTPAEGPVPDNQNMQKTWTDSIRDRAETVRKILSSVGPKDAAIRAMCAAALAEADGMVATHSGPTRPDGALTREQVQAFAQASEKLSEAEEALGIALEE